MAPSPVPTCSSSSRLPVHGTAPCPLSPRCPHAVPAGARCGTCLASTSQPGPAPGCRGGCGNAVPGHNWWQIWVAEPAGASPAPVAPILQAQILPPCILHPHILHLPGSCQDAAGYPHPPWGARTVGGHTPITPSVPPAVPLPFPCPRCTPHFNTPHFPPRHCSRGQEAAVGPVPGAGARCPVPVPVPWPCRVTLAPLPGRRLRAEGLFLLGAGALFTLLNLFQEKGEGVSPPGHRGLVLAYPPPRPPGLDSGGWHGTGPPVLHPQPHSDTPRATGSSPGSAPGSWLGQQLPLPDSSSLPGNGKNRPWDPAGGGAKAGRGRDSSGNSFILHIPLLRPTTCEPSSPFPFRRHPKFDLPKSQTCEQPQQPPCCRAMCGRVPAGTWACRSGHRHRHRHRPGHGGDTAPCVRIAISRATRVPCVSPVTRPRVLREGRSFSRERGKRSSVCSGLLSRGCSVRGLRLCCSGGCARSLQGDTRVRRPPPVLRRGTPASRVSACRDHPRPPARPVGSGAGGHRPGGPRAGTGPAPHPRGSHRPHRRRRMRAEPRSPVPGVPCPVPTPAPPPPRAAHPRAGHPRARGRSAPMPPAPPAPPPRGAGGR
ncbi:basic proline-rich protein-like [Ammospiza nelsoni]|uniref:basic proline-rich protein-like n=1 Tax=Ammospiza nelsoni TaxID=2857394 RepID=UPI00286D0DC8|nr:basic proline-rich protein-like [Ammospiza nelsoni]